MNIKIEKADLDSVTFIDLIDSHKALMLEHSPAESSHALLIDGLRAQDILVWSMFATDILIGCGALKVLSPRHGEIKSMHTIPPYRGQGLGKKMLFHIIAEARIRGMRHLSLETGSQPGFLRARRMYESNGFAYCGPFGDYVEDPHSVFMTREFA